MSSTPCVRARATLELLEFMDEFQPGLREATRRRIDPEQLQLIESCLPAGWLPIAQSRLVVQAAVDELGRDRAAALWREFFVKRYLRSPILRGFMQAAIRLFGTSPSALARSLPRGWATTYRDVAEVEVEPGEQSVTIRLVRIADELFRDDTYFVALEGAFSGFMDIAYRQGTIVTRLDPGAKTAEFFLSW